MGDSGTMDVADYDRMLDIADRAYAAALGEAAWAPALTRLADLLGGAAVSVEAAERATGRALYLDGARLDPASAGEYVAHYHALSPRVGLAVDRPTLMIAYDRLLIDEAEMRRDPFYSDFLARQNLRYFVSARVDPAADTWGVLAVQRSPRAGHVEAAEIDRLKALRPHLARAFTLFWQRSRRGIDAGRLDRALARLGLTPAERALAAALAAGDSVTAHARTRGISVNTAYTHYKRLKGKLDCHRQPALIARLGALARGE